MDFGNTVTLAFNTVYDLKEVEESLIKIGMREVYFARMNDFYNPIDKPEEENGVFIIAKK